MKRLLICIALMVIALPTYARMNVGVVGGGGGGTAAAITYFGREVVGGTSANLQSLSICNNDAVLQFTCPGTGSKTLVELGAYVSTATAGNVRVAIYADDRDPLIAQGSAEIAVGAVGWYTHTDFVDSAGAPISGTGLLTGGVDYTICMTADGSVQHYHDTVTNSGAYLSNDYTGGFPAAFAGAGASSRQITIRAGVQ